MAIFLPFIILQLLANILFCIIGTPIILLLALKFGNGDNYKQRLVSIYKKVLASADFSFYG
jgi:hypothetical protein